MALHFIDFLQIYDRKYRTMSAGRLIGQSFTVIPSLYNKKLSKKFSTSSWLINFEVNLIEYELKGVVYFYLELPTFLLSLVLQIFFINRQTFISKYHSISFFLVHFTLPEL